MAKHEAVDRLMALATEKRADRTLKMAPGVRVTANTTEEGSSLAAAAELKQASAALAPAGVDTPGRNASKAAPGYRGRQLLQAMRPLLPALAGALRLVDHGAVQTAARLLPLLGGSGAAGVGQPAAQEQFARALLTMDAAQDEMVKQLHMLQLKATENEEQIGRMRAQLERVAADATAAILESQKLAMRVRLLAAGVLVLLMLVIEQMILLGITLHK